VNAIIIKTCIATKFFVVLTFCIGIGIGLFRHVIDQKFHEVGIEIFVDEGMAQI
jgi:hypothetical protein